MGGPIREAKLVVIYVPLDNLLTNILESVTKEKER